MKNLSTALSRRNGTTPTTRSSCRTTRTRKLSHAQGQRNGRRVSTKYRTTHPSRPSPLQTLPLTTRATPPPPWNTLTCCRRLSLTTREKFRVPAARYNTLKRPVIAPLTRSLATTPTLPWAARYMQKRMEGPTTPAPQHGAMAYMKRTKRHTLSLTRQRAGVLWVARRRRSPTWTASKPALRPATTRNPLSLSALRLTRERRPRPPYLLLTSRMVTFAHAPASRYG